jgi:hypothetical protein
MVGLLNKTRCYLMGAMENSDGQPWRNRIKQLLENTGITFFDPYEKPFINTVSENKKARIKLKSWMDNGEYDLAAKRMKRVRSDDLRLCDLSDFGVVQILPNVPTWGTVEEMVWFVRCKKPLFVFVEGGKQHTPLWLMGMFPHKYIYDSVDDIIKMLKRINAGRKKLDNERWKLLRREFR